MVSIRVRIRFSKEGDLRWISHRDLVRTWERLFRRCGLQLALSEGYHPKPRMSFPSALALGVSAADEVMEVRLAEQAAAEQLHQRLAGEAPSGLTVKHVEVLGPGDRKAKAVAARYQLPVPAERCAAAEQAVDALNRADSHSVSRHGKADAVDVKADLTDLKLRGDQLHFRLRLDRPGASAGPKDVLGALQLTDLVEQGGCLTRTELEVAR